MWNHQNKSNSNRRTKVGLLKKKTTFLAGYTTVNNSWKTTRIVAVQIIICTDTYLDVGNVDVMIVTSLDCSLFPFFIPYIIYSHDKNKCLFISYLIKTFIATVKSSPSSSIETNLWFMFICWLHSPTKMPREMLGFLLNIRVYAELCVDRIINDPQLRLNEYNAQL